MSQAGVKTPVEPGIIARMTAGVRYAITGKQPEWFGPGQPMQPQAQEQAKGRQFDFAFGQNISVKPRASESITFDDLRTLADSYDLLRLIIETRKDQMAKLTWSVKPKDPKAKPDKRCDAITAFLQFPDQEHNWQDWLRMILEDMLVIDAATVFPRMTLGGDLYALEPIDGATVKRVIDQTGRTPLPPDVAFQQVLKGFPAVDYSRDELIYKPRNLRTHKIYGYSPVEQIIMTVNIAIRRQIHQLQYYTEGNIPEAIIGVPAEWNPDQIRQFQEYWDSMLEGNTANRRHAKFVPGALKVTETKPNAMKDEYDEWLARVVCYAFSIEPTAFVKQTNRATAETAREQALSEGLAPLMVWVCDLMNYVIAKWFKSADLEFAWADEVSVDPDLESQIDDRNIRNGSMTIDEARAKRGQDPLPDGLGAVPMIVTAQGGVLLKDILEPPPPPEPPAPLMLPAPGADDPNAQVKEPPEPPAGKYLGSAVTKKKSY